MPSINSSSNSPSTSAKGAAYWRSLEEYAQTTEFQEMVEREFPSMSPDVADEPSRRQFLKVMGASLALAGLTGCRWPEEKILPFTSRPAGWVPGVPEHYATAMELGGTARGLLVKSYDGRPIKVEGNPLHPESQGASDVLSQAAILEMYDPDRSQSVKQREGGNAYTRTWDEWAAAFQPTMDGHRRDGGRSLVILHAATSSEAFAMVKQEWTNAFPQARWVEYEPISRDNEREGTRLVYGDPYRVNYQLEDARVIVTFDEDLLVAHPAAVKYAFDYAQGRIVRDKQMNRLYAIESNLSATGGVADTRIAVAPSEVESLLAELAAELFLGRGLPAPLDPAARTQLQEARAHAKHGPVVRQLAEDLTSHRGHGVVAAGARLSPRSHGLALLINEALGNVGSTVLFHPDPDPSRASHVDALRQLTSDIDRGDVSTLFILGGNPVYDAPSDFAFAEKLDKVANSVHLGVYENETSQACGWHLPQAHVFESWSDARAYDGTRSVVQPLIRPLYGGKTAAEALAFLGGRAKSHGHELVREALASALGGLDTEAAWRKALHDGVIPGTASPRVRPTLGSEVLGGSTPAGVARHADAGHVDVVFIADPKVYDGRFANNGWLQELPDALTKVAWDNAALIAPSTAKAISVSHGDMLRFDLDGRSVEVAAYILPGQAPNTATLPLGYGRTVSGKVGTDVGFNVYPLRSSSTMHYALGVSVSKTGARHDVFATQDHFPIDPKGEASRQSRLHSLVQEASLDDYLHGHHKPHSHHPEPIPLWEEHNYDHDNKWGLSIDLNTCIGCNACVVACQAENNIPVVGKDNVGDGREMHWIRIDRYFRGDDVDQPGVAFQPVTCMHCENAPCEQVCPVAATVHSHEGLNDMVYNRCIGTRYCSNNCPYKVRRFNYFNYNGGMSATEKMRSNPEVTVRSRGVMEKCSFCIQRISTARIHSKNEGRPIRDGEIVTACQQACPTRAITFGDLNDPEAAITAKHADSRSYAMLNAELYTRPRVHYMTRLRNAAPGLASSGTGKGSGHDSGHGGTEGESHG